MMFSYLGIVALLFYILGFAIASPQLVSPALAIVPSTINERRKTTADVKGIIHGTNVYPRHQSHNFQRKSLAQSLTDTTIFEWPLAGPDIKLICKTCYVGGSVSGYIGSTGENFNFSSIVSSVEDEVKDIINSVRSPLIDWVEDSVEGDDKPFPQLHPHMNISNIHGLPDGVAHFELDGLEIYLNLDIMASNASTHQITLFELPLGGIDIDGTQVGPALSFELILVSSSPLEIEGGIHVKFDDGFVFEADMFRNMSSLALSGGHYESLPMYVNGNGSIQAILNMKMGVGVQLPQFNFTSSLSDGSGLSFSAGIEANAFAYLADLTINANSSSKTPKNCAADADLEYTVAVGAGAGATVAAGTHNWGPQATTTVPIWYSTLASTCAHSKTSTVAPKVTPRAPFDILHPFKHDSSTGVPTTTLQVVSCLEQGVVNCPAESQSTIYITTTNQPVPSSYVPATVTSFGSNKQKIFSTSGAPVSYVPPPPLPPSPTVTTATTAGPSKDGIDAAHKYARKLNLKLILGLSIGLGVPFILALLIGARYYLKHKYSKPSQPPQQPAQQEYLLPTYDAVTKDRAMVMGRPANSW